MDERQFDRLTRLLRHPGTRRQTLIAGIAAWAGFAIAAEETDAKCLHIGQRCGKRSGKYGGPCTRCCTGYATQTTGMRCTCRPDGFSCRSHGVCCGGDCRGGACGDRGICTPLNQLCAPGGICCNMEARCQTHSGQDAQLRCCVTFGNPCSTSGDCCTGLCNGESGVCENAVSSASDSSTGSPPPMTNT